jgi:hypothetical protein
MSPPAAMPAGYHRRLRHLQLASSAASLAFFAAVAVVGWVTVSALKPWLLHLVLAAELVFAAVFFRRKARLDVVPPRHEPSLNEGWTHFRWAARSCSGGLGGGCAVTCRGRQARVAHVAGCPEKAERGADRQRKARPWRQLPSSCTLPAGAAPRRRFIESGPSIARHTTVGELLKQWFGNVKDSEIKRDNVADLLAYGFFFRCSRRALRPVLLAPCARRLAWRHGGV